MSKSIKNRYHHNNNNKDIIITVIGMSIPLNYINKVGVGELFNYRVIRVNFQ